MTGRPSNPSVARFASSKRESEAVLLDPYGNLARRTQIPLTAAGIRCLVDGRAFIRAHASILPSLHLEPFCRVCVAHGGSGDVATTVHEDCVEFRCGHVAGKVRTDRPLDVEPLLDALSWGVRCTACKESAAGDNSKASARFTVECPCTTRELANPLAASLPLASREA
jgi:hypothetical protein